MRKIAAYFISIYQTRISPHKGYTCAHRGLHKGDSCSEYTKKQILENGLLSSLKSIQQRFGECRQAALSNQRNNMKYQRGDCDLGCYGLPSFKKGNFKENIKDGLITIVALIIVFSLIYLVVTYL